MQENIFQEREHHGNHGNLGNCGNRGNSAKITRKVPFKNKEIYF